MRHLGAAFAKRTIVLGLVMAMCAVFVAAAVPSGASGVKLTLVGGNASGGKLEQEAASIAKTKLVGPKGTGLTRGITSTSINIGCIDTAADYTGYQQGIQAEFNAVNSAGGIDGRKLTLDPGTCDDDANSVQTNVSDVQALVNQDSDFAVLSLTENILPGSTNFLNQNQVPYFGWGFNPGFCGNRWGFGWNGCLGGNGFPEPLEAIAGNLAEAIIKASGLPAKKVRFAVEAENATSGHIGDAQYDALFAALGAKVVYSEANYPTTASGVDNTPYAQAIVAAKPNIVYISTPFDDVGPLADALKAAGYKGVIMDFTNYIPGLLQASSQLASALQGEYVNTQIVPDEQDTAFIQTAENQLAAIGQPKFVTLGGEIGYIEALELVGMLKAVGSNLNTKTFDQTVNGGKFTSFANAPAGGPGKLDWPAAHYLPSDCAAIVRVSGTAYNVVEPFSCYSSYKVG